MTVRTTSPLPRLTRWEERQGLEWAKRLVEDLYRRFGEQGVAINAGTGGGASTAEPYVTMALTAGLSAERALAVTAGELVLADGGANANVTLGLATVGSATGPLGSATRAPVVTIDAKGRVTALTDVAISGVAPGGAAGGDLSGTYPNPSVVDDSHDHTASTLPSSIVYDGDTAGGDLTGTYPNPTLADADLIAIRDLVATAGMLSRTGAGAFAARTLTAPAAGITITNPAGVAGNPTFVLADDLAGLEGMSGTGLVARTASNTYAQRTLTGPAAGITVSNGDGVSGNPTLALANDLSALEGLGSTGIAVRTGSDAWAQRTITAGNGILLTDGNGVSGNPTIDLTINALTTETTLAAGDLFAFQDVSVGTTPASQRKVTLGNLAVGLNTLGTLDHGSLAGLTDDDHAGYTRIAGRTGTTNDTILSTSTDGTLTGSSNSGSALVLKAASAGTGVIQAVDELRLRTGFTTLAGAGAGNAYLAQAALATTITSLANVTRVLGVTGTVDDQAGVNFIYLFSNEATYKRSTAAVFGGYTINALANTPTIQSDGIALASGTAQGFTHSPTYNRINAGTMTGVVDNAIICTLTLGAGCTMATRRGLYVQNASVSGTLTTQAAVDIEALTTATTNIGIRNASTEVATPLERQLAAAGDIISATVGTASPGTGTMPRAKVIRLNNTSGGALTMTSAPTVSDGQDGQLLILFNGSANAVTIQDQGTLASSNLRLSANTIALGTRDSIILLYSSTVGDWIEIGQTNVL